MPPKTAPSPPVLDEAAAGTLKGVTYVTFDVALTPANLVTGKKSG